MKQTIGVLLFAVFFAIMSVPAMASSSNTYSTKTVTTSSPTSGGSTLQESVSAQTEQVTIQEAEKWAERKGFELVHLLQKVVQPFAIIIFIISAFMAMAGGFGNSQLVGRGLWGMTIAVIMYAVVLYAPEIMDSVLGWLTS